MVADLYAGTVVLKLYSAGLTPVRGLLVDALRALPGVRAVLGRDELGGEEGDEDGKGGARLLWGEEPPDPVVIRERGVRFGVDVRRGQKTGFFLDQRENRALVRRLSPRRVGAQLLQLQRRVQRQRGARRGASRVFSVDQDADAIALARENFVRNGLDPNAHDFLAADVFDAAVVLPRRGPPLRRRRPRPAGLRQEPAGGARRRIDGYASLNRQALEVVAPGGLLVTASCSARVTPEAFEGAVKEAGLQGRGGPDAASRSATSRRTIRCGSSFPRGATSSSSCSG